MSAGTVSVEFGGVFATNVVVAGNSWITGYIPSNPDGQCPTFVKVSFEGATLTMPDHFCYLPDLPPAALPYPHTIVA